MRITRLVLAVLTAACSATPSTFSPADASASDAVATDAATLDAAPSDAAPIAEATYARMGTPAWNVTCALTAIPASADAAMYVASVGRFVAAAVNPEHATEPPGFGIGRGQAHGPPYDGEPARMLTRGGAPPRSVLLRDEVSTTGTGFVICAVAANSDAAIADTSDGPVPGIPQALFPMVTTARWTFGATPFPVERESIPLPFSGIPPRFAVSHFLLRYGQQVDFEASDQLPLESQFQLTILDATGQGYRATLPFRVVDPPR